MLASVGQYRCYDAFKGVDFVVVEQSYLRRNHVNEKELLDSLISADRAGVAYRDPSSRFTVYDVRRFTSERSKPRSLLECGLY